MYFDQKGITSTPVLPPYFFFENFKLEFVIGWKLFKKNAGIRVSVKVKFAQKGWNKLYFEL